MRVSGSPLFHWALRLVGSPDAPILRFPFPCRPFEGILQALKTFSGGLKDLMAAITSIALRALSRLGGPRILLAAVPGGAKAVSAAAGVSTGRVSQVLRQPRLPREWASLFADLLDCAEWEVYAQLGQPVTDAVTTTPEHHVGPEVS